MVESMRLIMRESIEKHLEEESPKPKTKINLNKIRLSEAVGKEPACNQDIEFPSQQQI